MILRPRQLEAYDAIREAFREHRRVLYTAPTGFGKTPLFCAAAKFNYDRGRHVTIIVHRQELIDQVRHTLAAFGVPHGVVAPTFSRTDHLVQVASVFTLARRIGAATEPALAIVDEAHHCVPSTTWGAVTGSWRRAKILGVTATPTRLDGTGLGDTFDTLVLGPTVQQGIDEGWLAGVRVFAPPTVDTEGIHTRFGEFVRGEVVARVDRPGITGDVITHYRRHADGKQALVFCASIEHAKHVEAAFIEAGISAQSIDGNSGISERRTAVERFRTRQIRALVTVDLVSEGFDVPDTLECGILLRATASTGLFLQQIGRCLRPKPDGSRAIILDHVGNTQRHGWPASERQWDLRGTTESGRSGRNRNPAGVRICPECFAANRVGRPVCVECHTAFPVVARKIIVRDGVLFELTGEEAQAEIDRINKRKQQGAAQSIEGLTRLGIERGYEPYKARRWAEHVWHGRRAKQHRSIRLP